MAAPPSRPRSAPARDNGDDDLGIARPPEELLQQVQADVSRAGGELAPEPDRAGAIGATMFDLPGSEDNSVTVLLPREQAQQAPSQSLVRIRSRDGRKYLGIVTAGPFAEPDTLRGDSHLLVTVTARGGIYLPPYHGRLQVTILGEELADGTLVPPRLRPLPNSPVVALTQEEVAAVLHTDGDIRLGCVVGASDVIVNVPSDKKSVLPRHLAVLGTTGGGKSTTISRLIEQAQAAGMAVILLDVEGEYTQIHEPTQDKKMLAALKERGLEARGVPEASTTLYHLIGRDTTNRRHPRRREFSLQLARLSPYAIMEILDLSEPQQQRFMNAYDVTKEVMRDLGIFPEKKNGEQERMAAEIDEFERGYPRLTLSLLLDVVGACHALADRPAGEGRRSRARKDDDEHEDESCAFEPFNARLRTPEGKQALRTRLHAAKIQGNAISWRALLGKLGRLNRLKVFYNEQGGANPMNYKHLLRPGSVSVIDLSDSGASELNNLVIADLLHGVQDVQDEAYAEYEKAKAAVETSPPPPRVLIVIEEAHEFLSAERIDKMRILFEQVSTIARRGRKRWLSLAFVTQLPQHLPRAVFGLCNSYVLHKITDAQVAHELQRTVSGIDESLWKRLTGLAPGQAIVSFPHLARPLLVAVDPSPCKLRMVD
jgi:DNA helicase HerA-like ATPase